MTHLNDGDNLYPSTLRAFEDNDPCSDSDCDACSDSDMSQVSAIEAPGAQTSYTLDDRPETVIERRGGGPMSVDSEDHSEPWHTQSQYQPSCSDERLLEAEVQPSFPGSDGSFVKRELPIAFHPVRLQVFFFILISLNLPHPTTECVHGKSTWEHGTFRLGASGHPILSSTSIPRQISARGHGSSQSPRIG